MPHLKSFHSLTPVGPTVNYYDFLLGRPELKSSSDYTLFVDAMTGKKRRFRETLARIEECATALNSAKKDGGLEIKPESKEVVGILSENCLEYPVLALALLKISVPVVFIPAHLPTDDTTALLIRASIRTLFISPKLYARRLEAVMASGVPEERVFILQGHVEGKTNLSELINNVKLRSLPSVPTQPVRSDTLACVMFSNGTAGFSKAAMISHQNLYHSTVKAEIMRQMPGQENAPPATSEKIPISLAAIPFDHTTGANAFILRLFVTPTTLVILPQWNVDLVVKILLQHTITQITMVPSMMYQLLNHPEFSKVDLDNLESISTSAGQLHSDFDEKFERRADNASLTEGTCTLFLEERDPKSSRSRYGLSERTLAVIAQPFPGVFKGRVERKRGLTGILPPGVKARIERGDGSEADFSEAEELFLRGRGPSEGYFNDRKNTPENPTPIGRRRIGDRSVADELAYVDRGVKETFKFHGAHASPSEIEKVIRGHPEVADCAIAGVRAVHDSGGFVPRAWLVLSASAKAKGVDRALKAIEKFVRDRVSERQWLHGGFEVIDEIPRLPSGKILRRQLQHTHESRERRKVRELAKL
ncbi:hypothetical protein B0F90DRAFT_1228622 [Multifurca ochricompacta]|uniref:Acetyl-CoA synthetase-like protein n=1 Tax=Multifurca ochricompacta TaxID=376703 RepID=A0AAD4M7D9_9AGAM|nr:hypothetical protein B0F90DRAFT_1228622 [Multifurca ochricompacta]